MPSSRNAVILLSGGLDSATTLAMARTAGFACHAITFDYGQRHRIELDAAQRVAKAMGVVNHVMMKIDLRAFGGSALTADIDVPKDRIDAAHKDDAHGLQSVGVETGTGPISSDIPVTYVPARNTIFLSLALGYAEAINCPDIFIGVNAVDYSGYPDCRPQFIMAFEYMANLATKMGVEGRHIIIHTPLINMTKAQIIAKGVELGVDYSLTTSCYDPRNGQACGHCDSCLLRAAGFKSAGVADPAIR